MAKWNVGDLMYWIGDKITDPIEVYAYAGEIHDGAVLLGVRPDQSAVGINPRSKRLHRTLEDAVEYRRSKIASRIERLEEELALLKLVS